MHRIGGIAMKCETNHHCVSTKSIKKQTKALSVHSETMHIHLLRKFCVYWGRIVMHATADCSPTLFKYAGVMS